MTPKEKAKELVERFKKLRDESNLYYVLPIQDDAKQCALICVEQEYAGRIDELAKINEYLPEDIHFQAHFSLKKEYNEVKQEINKL